MFMPEMPCVFSAENVKMASSIISNSENFLSKLMGFLRRDIVEVDVFLIVTADRVYAVQGKGKCPGMVGALQPVKLRSIFAEIAQDRCAFTLLVMLKNVPQKYGLKHNTSVANMDSSSGNKERRTVAFAFFHRPISSLYRFCSCTVSQYMHCKCYFQWNPLQVIGLHNNDIFCQVGPF